MGDPERANRVAREPRRELGGVDVIGIVKRTAVRRHRPLPRRQLGRANRRLRTNRKGKRRAGRPRLPGADQIDRGPVEWRGERVIIEVFLRAGSPTVEARSLLERAVARGEELFLIEADRGQRCAHCRPSAFADPDGRDVGRLDQRDRRRLAGDLRNLGRNQTRGEPPGGSAADNNDALYRHVCGRSNIDGPSFSPVARVPPKGLRHSGMGESGIKPAPARSSRARPPCIARSRAKRNSRC